MSELSDVLLAIACPRVGSRGGQQKFKQVGVLDKRSCSSMNIFLNAHIMDIGRVMTSALVLLFKTVLFNSCDGWQPTNQTKQHKPPANNLARVAVLASRWHGLQVDDDDKDWMVMTMIGLWMVIMMTIMKSNFILMIQTMQWYSDFQDFWLVRVRGEIFSSEIKKKARRNKKYFKEVEEKNIIAN